MSFIAVANRTEANRNKKAYNQKLLNMDDVTFLDCIINKNDKTKVIKHIFVVPFKSYQFNKVLKLDMLSNNFTKLPTANQLTSSSLARSTWFTDRYYVKFDYSITAGLDI